jgi:hypothetical protein
MRRGLCAAVGVALVAAACGGSGAETTTPTVPSEIRAEEFAVSARRALADTRFEVLGDRWLVELILNGCGRLQPGTDGAAALAALALGTAAGLPPADTTEDRILVEVLAAGVVDVCPEAFAAATTTTVTERDPEDDYLVVVGPIADEAGLSVLPGVLLDAGGAVCEALDRGDGPERGVLDAAGILFGIAADELGDLEEQGPLAASDGAVLGSVLAAAASYLCPQHADTVVSYISVLEAGG